MAVNPARRDDLRSVPERSSVPRCTVCHRDLPTEDCWVCCVDPGCPKKWSCPQVEHARTYVCLICFDADTPASTDEEKSESETS